MIEHGTYAGTQRHKREHTPTCRPCMDAGAYYIFQWRRRAWIAAVGALVQDRPELADVRAPVARFVAGIKENA